MKSLYKILAVACLVMGFAACDNEQLTGESIFIDPVIDTTTYTYQFDKWLDKYYTLLPVERSPSMVERP